MYFSGGVEVALNLQISRLKVKVHLEDTPHSEFHQTMHRRSLSDPL